MAIKVMSVFGTRPEAIKMLPLVDKINHHPALEGLVCVTAQHREMLDQVLEAAGIVPDFDLDLMMPQQTLTDITAKVIHGLQKVLEQVHPDVLLIHGDTTTSFAAALAAFYQQITVGHVEAGLRTYDRYSPYPEEMNRNLSAKLTTLHFAPTTLNKENLIKENIHDHIYVTGNTAIDALMKNVRPNYLFADETLRSLDLANHDLLLLTAHRRENLGQPMRNIFMAVLDLLELYPRLVVVYPVHKNPLVQDLASEVLGNHPRVSLIEPLSMTDIHNLFALCHLVLTDSGGIQEEAPALGKPTLVLRTETERPEALAAGTAKLVGVERENIVNQVRLLMEDKTEYEKMSLAKNPYGDGHASERICDILATFYGEEQYYRVGNLN